MECDEGSINIATFHLAANYSQPGVWLLEENSLASSQFLISSTERMFPSICLWI